MIILLPSLEPPHVQEVDLYTVVPNELSFSAPYCLTAKKNDYIDALVSYFTVEFTKCHKRTGITTCKRGGQES